MSQSNSAQSRKPVKFTNSFELTQTALQAKRQKILPSSNHMILLETFAKGLLPLFLNIWEVLEYYGDRDHTK